MISKIKFDKAKQVILINDRLRRNYHSLVYLCLLDVFISAVNVIGFVGSSFNHWNIVWLLIGIGALLYAAYIVLMKSSQNKIHFHEIELLTEKQRFGKVVYSLKLKNGKSRDLPNIENKEEFEDLKLVLNGYPRGFRDVNG
ncbi:MAG TPA: hypothetical protein VKA27_11740 [Sunxiuqinia sp.]|nr:hypothetical protein [Sunxiuqinia sp.]